jgi:hypothetical protein
MGCNRSRFRSLFEMNLIQYRLIQLPVNTNKNFIQHVVYCCVEPALGFLYIALEGEP